MEKEREFFPKRERQKKRMILAGFCLSAIAAAALIGRSNYENNQDRTQDEFQPTPVGTFIMPDQTSTFLAERLLVERKKPIATPNFPETPIPTPVISDDKEPIQVASEVIIPTQVVPTQQPIESQTPTLLPESQPVEEITPISVEASSPPAVGSEEVQADDSTKPRGGETVQGVATYYGVDDGYGWGDTLGCTGELFDPYDPTTAARPWSSPFKCGDKVEVCDSDSCIEVVIKDTCPGCDDFGIVIDLSKGAMQLLSPGAGRTWVTLKKSE